MSRSNPNLKRKASPSELAAMRPPPSPAASRFNALVDDKLDMIKSAFDAFEPRVVAGMLLNAFTSADPNLSKNESDFKSRMDNEPGFYDRLAALRDKNNWARSNWAGIYPLLGLPPLSTILSVDVHASEVLDTGLPNPPTTPAPNIYSIIASSSTGTVNMTVGQLIEDFKEDVKSFISQSNPLALWSPPAEFQHCQPLKIPAPYGTSPKLLLHELGEWLHKSSTNKSLNDLVHVQNNMFVYNASGSGKTRLVLEALCHRWGVYVSFADTKTEDFGTGEMTTLITRIKTTRGFSSSIDQFSDSPTQTEHNHEIAENLSRSTLLARLVLFRAFLQVCKAEDHPAAMKLWLRIQLYPTTILKYPRIVSLMASSFMDHGEPAVISSAFLAVCQEIEHKIKGQFVIVVDECQVPTNTFPGAFGTDAKPRSLLRPFLSALANSGSDPYFIILTGTGIDKETVARTFNSTHGKKPWNEVSDLGGFDEKRSQEDYIAKFLFPNHRPYSPQQSMFLARCWHYLRGRHRYTVGFVEAVLSLGSLAYDVILDKYIVDMTSVQPQDRHSNDEDIPVALPTGPIVSSINFSNLSRIDTKLHNAILGMVGDWLIDRRKKTLHMDAYKYAIVEVGFARLMKPGPGFRGKKSESLIYEVKDPLVLLAARKYFEPSFPDLMLQAITHAASPAAQGGSLDKVIAYFLTMQFDNFTTLGHVFHFPPNVDKKWSELRGRLAAPCGEDIFPASWNNGVHTSLARWTQSASETVSWFQDREGIPILRPDVNMKPDIIALLQLEDGEHVWLAIQVKLRRPRFILSEVKEGAESLVPEKWWTRKAILSDSDSENQNAVCKIMADVPRLHDPNIANDVLSTDIPQQTLKQKGFLRVLAYVGDIDIQDLEVAARDNAGPLALLNVDRLVDQFGVTIKQLQETMR